MKQKHHFIILSILVIFMAFLLGEIYHLTGLDIISFDTGGNGNISVNSDIFREPISPLLTCVAQGGQICISGQSCSGSFINASDTSLCCSGICSSPSAPPSPPPGGVSSPISNISISPTQFILNMLINTNIMENVSVTNIGGSTITINVNQTNLTNLVLITSNTLTLAPGRTTTLGLIFIAPNETGVFTGTINIGDRTLFVSLNVVKQFVLFDSNIVVLNRNALVPRGDPLMTQVTMIPIGDNVRMDVTLNYIIKDKNGTIYSTNSETLFVTSRQSIFRNFGTRNLPFGEYTINLELIYPNGVAPSSAHFEVTNNVRDWYGTIIYWLIFGIIIVGITLLVVITTRTIKKVRQEEQNERGNY